MSEMFVLFVNYTMFDEICNITIHSWPEKEATSLAIVGFKDEGPPKGVLWYSVSKERQRYRMSGTKMQPLTRKRPSWTVTCSAVSEFFINESISCVPFSVLINSLTD